MTKWANEDDSVLLEKWADGTPGIVREIANILNRTRNSIIGRANRKGLKHIKKSPNRVARVPDPMPRPVIARAAKPNFAPLLERDDLWTWAVDRTHLIHLRANQCRWPVGGMFFCGGEQKEGKAYCPIHCGWAHYQSKYSPALGQERPWSD